MKPTLLVVDSQEAQRETLLRLFDKQFQVVEAGDLRSAQQMLEGQKGKRLSPDLVLLEVQLPDGSGLELLEKLQPQVSAIVMTDYGDVEQAVDAMRRGAADYILKPFANEEIALRVQRALDGQCDKQLGSREASYVLGENSAMQKLYADVESVAASPSATVLIRGETGVGKEHIAHRVHSLSGRRSGPFVDINIAALSSELLESELFGHEQGAFTGAIRPKQGLIEVANGGTLFLDEIGDMELPLQAKIVRVLEERVLRRVGGTKNLPVDIRLITATHRDLEKLVQEGRFREDLYYRLHVVPLEVPPLRERLEDLEALCSHFLERLNGELGREVRGLESGALELLRSHSWPGNVRELRNILERAVLLECRGNRISADDLKFSSSFGESLSLDAVEAAHIGKVLSECNGDRGQAAEKLGIDRATLTKKLRKHEMS